MTEDIESVLNEYAPLVRKIARSACYSSAAIDMADLYQVGEIAVLRAIKAYDPSSGASIRSFVSKLVRQDVYNEAARFLGVFTVDHRVTNLAAKVNRLANKGHDDIEIAAILNKASTRVFDADHVRDLRIAYNRRQHAVINEDDTLDQEYTDERTIRHLLESVIENDVERTILKLRILGSNSVGTVARTLKLTRRQVYQIEADLKLRIKKAIEGVTE